MAPDGDENEQRITLDPDPPVQGAQLRICYNFSGSGVSSTTLKVTFDNGPSSNYEVAVGQPCVTITVPSDASSITVEDLDGSSPDKNAPVVPS